jgi:hypothetical protein
MEDVMANVVELRIDLTDEQAQKSLERFKHRGNCIDIEIDVEFNPQSLDVVCKMIATPSLPIFRARNYTGISDSGFNEYYSAITLYAEPTVLREKIVEVLERAHRRLNDIIKAHMDYGADVATSWSATLSAENYHLYPKE